MLNPLIHIAKNNLYIINNQTHANILIDTTKELELSLKERKLLSAL